ncbi:hypothetical protein [Petropleomorpha daqingensis]|uniref:rRNA-processing protein FCF1 n=1 Tax=Petropleomorpha daqingensis TaxID=2026353 RepID=A0A853CJ53_9ACTN|nr:hypothetical protein [Petropleomorpha daqingensis]NYJ08054.1 rRNA-processing protein FCF1 [Petropleomorpha daqingensis]
MDNVTLSRMTPNQRASAFMHDRCRIPEEIIYEARGLPDVEMLKSLIYPITTTVLENVRIVLATIKAGDKVVDLYRNEGNGDVMLLATALTEMAVSEGQLIGDRWIIATADKGLTTKAVELGVLTCTSDQFIALV